MPLSEALEIAVVGADAWPDIWPIFRRVIAGGDTYPYPPDMSESEGRQVWVHDEPPRAVTFLARLGDQVVGTAYLKPNQVGLGDHVANAGWMIDPDHQGRGLGGRFAEHVIAGARGRGYRSMQFNSVVSTNSGAVRLWESLGFEIVGTVPDAFRHATEGLVAVYVMYREL